MTEDFKSPEIPIKIFLCISTHSLLGDGKELLFPFLYIDKQRQLWDKMSPGRESR